MTLKIEPATFKDLEELARVEKESFASEAYSKRQLAFLLVGSDAVSFVARIDSETVGFVIGVKEQYGKETVGHVVTIDVAPKHRRTGLGLKLLDRLEQEFLKQGTKTVYLEVRVDNEAARRLYIRKGYNIVEPLENYYDKGKHGLRMIKRLH